MSPRLTAVLVLVIATTANPALAIVDQEFAPIPGDLYRVANVGSSNNIDWAQTFTVGVSGLLTGVDVWIARESVVSEPLIYDIRTVVAGKPSDPDFGPNILASGIIPAHSIPLVSVDLQPPTNPTHLGFGAGSFSVNAGMVLAIVLQTNDPGTTDARVAYQWNGRSPGSIAPGYDGGDDWVRLLGLGGANWEAGESNDLYFRTYVQIPEPAGSSLCIGIAITLSAVCRRGR